MTMPTVSRLRVFSAAFALAFATLLAPSAGLAVEPTTTPSLPSKNYPIQDFVNTIGLSGDTFSADESRILFSSNKSGVWNTYSIPATGGEWKAITTSTTDNNYSVTYFPHDDRVLVTADQGGNELNHLYVIGTDGERTDLTPGEKHKAAFGGFNRAGTYFYVATNERDPKYFDLYRYDAKTYQRQRIYENTEGYNVGALSDDERWLALVKPNTSNDSNLFVRELASGKTTKVSEHTGVASYNDAAFSPDSQWLYYLTNDGGEFSELRRVSTANWNHETVRKADWDLPAGEIRNLRFSRSDKKLAFYLNGDRQPNDLYVAALGDKPVQLTRSLNPAIDPKDLVDSQVVRFESFDKMVIPNILWKPHQATAAAKAPALVWVHGGPGGQTTRGHSAVIQFLANHGYVVLGINNRGSSGYGKTFFAADDGKHGREPLWDTIAAKKYLQTLDYVDGDKIGIIGGSYGGYMTAAALAFQPDEFAVGVDIFGVTNWLRTLEGIPAWWEAQREALYQEIGNPVTQRDMLIAISPAFHGDKITKPLMVLQGENDPRVVKAESDDLVAAVRKNGVPVEYVVFPDEGHGFSKPKNQIEGYGKVLEFLDKYLKGSNTP